MLYFDFFGVIFLLTHMNSRVSWSREAAALYLLHCSTLLVALTGCYSFKRLFLQQFTAAAALLRCER